MLQIRLPENRKGVHSQVKKIIWRIKNEMHTLEFHVVFPTKHFTSKNCTSLALQIFMYFQISWESFYKHYWAIVFFCLQLTNIGFSIYLCISPTHVHWILSYLRLLLSHLYLYCKIKVTTVNLKGQTMKDYLKQSLAYRSQRSCNFPARPSVKPCLLSS